jgi:hypothetical protein
MGRGKVQKKPCGAIFFMRIPFSGLDFRSGNAFLTITSFYALLAETLGYSIRINQLKMNNDNPS